MLIPIESRKFTRMHVASFTRLSESLGTRLEIAMLPTKLHTAILTSLGPNPKRNPPIEFLLQQNFP